MFTVRALVLALLLTFVLACGKGRDGGSDGNGGNGASDESAPESAEASAVGEVIDCAGDAQALWQAEPRVQHRDGAELHQVWLLADRSDLWSDATPVFDSLSQYRDRVRRTVPDTSALGLIRTNRELNPWLERDYPAEGRINRLVEAGVGTHRPMTCLETQLLAYQATRFPLYEQPSEIVALILKKSGAGVDRRDLVKVYIAADDDAIPPKPSWGIEAVELDVAQGWLFYSVFHNHTFDHSSDRGLLPVAAPSANDLQVSVALHDRLGLEFIWVTDGFSTLELAAPEFVELERAARPADQIAK